VEDGVTKEKAILDRLDQTVSSTADQSTTLERDNINARVKGQQGAGEIRWTEFVSTDLRLQGVLPFHSRASGGA
jgi:hypothetical protein